MFQVVIIVVDLIHVSSVAMLIPDSTLVTIRRLRADYPI